MAEDITNITFFNKESLVKYKGYLEGYCYSKLSQLLVQLIYTPIG